MTPGDGDLDAAARAALEHVLVSPTIAAERATTILARALDTQTFTAASIAERALGLAAAHVRDLNEAVDHLERGVALAERAGSRRLAGEVRMSFAGVLNRRGDADRALTEIDAAIASLRGLARGRALSQRGAILQERGSVEQALLDYHAAWPVLKRSEDLVWMQQLLMNRGVLNVDRQHYQAAARDLHRAEAICARLGLDLPSAFVAENLVLVYRRLGDVPRALDYLAKAEHLYRELGTPVGTLMIERGELLLSVRLMAEARDAAAAAVAEHERAQHQLGRAEARLLLARTILFSDPDGAGRQARRAVRELSAQDRSAWASLARYTALVARHLSPQSSVRVSELVAMADELRDRGWGSTSDDARLIAGRQALGTRNAELGREQLRQLSSQRRHGPAERRVRGWLAAALLAQDSGDSGRAATQAAVGLRTIEEYRATMAATDLRARISALGTDLAVIGLQHAVRHGSPWQVLLWAERGRARHLAERPATPPDDTELATLLSELRGVVSERTDQQRVAGDAVVLLRRQLQLEGAIRDHSRRQHGDGKTTALSLGREELTAGLGDAALVELIELEGQLRAVVLAGGRCRLVELGPIGPIGEQVAWLPFALRRLSRSGVDPRSRVSARRLIHQVAVRLDRALLGPLRSYLGDRPLVVAPTGVLQSLPWGLLPGAAGRPVTVTPTAGLWLAATTRRPHRGPVMAAAGPGLPGAEREVRAVAALWGVDPLDGPDASVGAVSRRLNAAGLAHLAAHGSVRADNPQFSALSYADGPLTVYDIERLQRGPDTVVLAACEAGRSVVLAGDELVGLASAFLAQDTRHLVASTTPLPDVETEAMMVALHRRLAGDQAVAEALAATQESLADADDRLWAAAAGFVCLGAGLSPAAIDRPAPTVAVLPGRSQGSVARSVAVPV